MPCCEMHVVCSRNHTDDLKNECCNPNVRETCKNITQAEIIDENCMKNRISCSSCCCLVSQECFSTIHHNECSKNIRDTESEDHLHCTAHSCPLGKVICCTDCQKNYCKNDKSVIKNKDITETREGITCYPVYHPDPICKDTSVIMEMPCRAKRASWTEPRICLRDARDPCGYLKHCGCGCGSTIITEPPNEKPKKTVRFADEVVSYEGDEKAFRNNSEDIKCVCSCSKISAATGMEQCIGKPYKPKYEDTGVAQEVFCYQKMPSRDPCQKLAEEYSSWRKISTGEKHNRHSVCHERDTDLQKVHFDECNVAHLPPQYQRHGYGHICEPFYHTTGEKFTLCEKGDAGESRYWWKRSCCKSERRHDEKSTELPPDLMKPVCPPFTTTYQLDFKDPRRLLKSTMKKRMYWGTCGVCENYALPQDQKEINLLCTENTREPFMMQRAGIV